jgi:N-carbamoyl-L-amino-acid hydrolase
VNASPLHVNGKRLWQSLRDMARIGATPDGGVCRLALTKEDREARQLLERWAQQSGLGAQVDAMGNMFIRRAGRDDALAPVVTGSHMDSQPTGGCYDGIYGVLAGLEVLRSLNDHGVQTLRPVELVNWTNEEGSRFAPAMIASGVFAGIFDLEYGLAATDAQGISIGQSLQDIGYAGALPVGGRPIHAAFELHIEQGPVLETENIDIGIVTGAQGQRWFELELHGGSAHAGTTPMLRRRDALVGFARVVEAVYRLGLAQGEHGRATVGMVQVSPNSRNVVPGKVFFTVEFRHPDDAVLDGLEQSLQTQVRHIAEALKLEWRIDKIFQYAPVSFDEGCIRTVRNAAKTLGCRHCDIISGAGHDACCLGRVAPTAMIFIPCEAGVSHNPKESILEDWSTKGANVLLHAVLSKANERA